MTREPPILVESGTDCKYEKGATIEAMRGTLAAILLAAATASAAAAAPPVAPITGQPGVGSLTASLSSVKAGAKRVELTLSLHAYLVCGQPGTVVVRFPAGVTVPATVAPTAVLVDKVPAAAVTVRLRQVTITAAHHGGATCTVLAPGLVTLRFTTSARLGNPASPGTYTITVEHGRETYRAAVRISA